MDGLNGIKEIDIRWNDIPSEQGIEQAELPNLDKELKKKVENFEQNKINPNEVNGKIN